MHRKGTIGEMVKKDSERVKTLKKWEARDIWHINMFQVVSALSLEDIERKWYGWEKIWEFKKLLAFLTNKTSTTKVRIIAASRMHTCLVGSGSLYVSGLVKGTTPDSKIPGGTISSIEKEALSKSLLRALKVIKMAIQDVIPLYKDEWIGEDLVFYPPPSLSKLDM